MDNGLLFRCCLLPGVVLMFPLTSVAAAPDNKDYIYTRIIYEVQNTGYSQSQSREQLTGEGLFLSVDYLDHGGFVIGQGSRNVSTRNDTVRSEEKSTFISGNVKFSFDKVPGKFSLRVDDHTIEDKSATLTRYFDNSFSTSRVQGQDDISSRSVMVSYISYRQDVYTDLAYSTTRFHAQDRMLDDLDVSQISPAIGASFNRRYDWMQCRAFFIRHDDSNRIAENTHTTSYLFKWTHWLQAPYYYPHNTQIALRVGKALTPVDYDAGIVYTVPDVLTRALSVSATWKFTDSLQALLFAGWEHYITTDGKDHYDGRTMYMNLSVLW